MLQPPKGKPIPVRLDPAEAAEVEALARETGLPKAEILRRCVRFTLTSAQHHGSKAFWLEISTPLRSLILNYEVVRNYLTRKSGKSTARQLSGITEREMRQLEQETSTTALVAEGQKDYGNKKTSRSKSS